MPFGTHPLATEPGSPVRFTFHERHESQRRGSNPLRDLGKVVCHRKHFADLEPARRIELRLSPYRGDVLPLSLSRHSWPSRPRTWKVSGVKARRVCQFLQRPSRARGLPARRALPQGRTGRAALTRSGRTPVRRAHLEPPSGVEPDHPAYEAGAASRARRRSCRTRTRTSIRGFRDRCPAIRRSGIVIQNRAGESNPVYSWLEARCPTCWACTACDKISRRGEGGNRTHFVNACKARPLP
jgi:hypothetical protein